jgi:hypothetical protein
MTRGLLVLAALIAWPAAPAADLSDRMSRTITPGPGATLALAATIAEVTITAWAKPDVQVKVARRAPDAQTLARLPVLVEQHGSRIDVTATQESGGRDPEIRATIEISAPAVLRLDQVAIFEGRLEIAGMRGGVTAVLERGPIEAESLGGEIRLESGIGDVTLADARLEEQGVIRLRAFNGDVALALREVPAHARILALALNGRIRSAIPLTMKDQFGPRFGQATLGRGEPVISIDTVTGDIGITVAGRQLEDDDHRAGEQGREIDVRVGSDQRH